MNETSNPPDFPPEHADQPARGVKTPELFLRDSFESWLTKYRQRLIRLCGRPRADADGNSAESD